ncbi:MAG: hypothetical protein ACRDPW_11135, partial [Mycobacteriales bacterium]
MTTALTWQNVLRPETMEPGQLALLPPDLAAKIATTGWRPDKDPIRGVEHHRFNLLATELLKVAGGSVERFEPKYHNLVHFRAVYAGVRDQLTQLSRDDDTVPTGVRHALLLAAAGHDRDHPA